MIRLLARCGVGWEEIQSGQPRDASRVLFLNWARGRDSNGTS